MVQYYFRNKDEMLLFALSSMTEQVNHRVGQRFTGLVDRDDPKQQVRATLLEMLPLDDERRLEGHVGCAFLARAQVEPRIAQYLHDGHVEGHAYLVAQISQSRTADAAREADTLFALVSGFTMTVLAGQYMPQAALDAQLDRIFDH